MTPRMGHDNPTNPGRGGVIHQSSTSSTALVVVFLRVIRQRCRAPSRNSAQMAVCLVAICAVPLRRYNIDHRPRDWFITGRRSVV